MERKVDDRSRAPRAAPTATEPQAHTLGLRLGDAPRHPRCRLLRRRGGGRRQHRRPRPHRIRRARHGRLPRASCRQEERAAHRAVDPLAVDRRRCRLLRHRVERVPSRSPRHRHRLHAAPRPGRSVLRPRHRRLSEAAAVSETPELRALFSPPRFKVLGFLVQVEESDYASIGEFTDLGVPEISRTVKFLDEAGLVQVRKGQKGRYPQTLVRATPSGRERFRELLADLQRYGLGG
ncbi:hypothetical protein C5E05_14045 [Pseudoclavibacter sp. AY1H1]|nr:hypothetical protein C5E05_14045 [Pseudoclavibacter sp. AY1H1]